MKKKAESIRQRKHKCVEIQQYKYGNVCKRFTRLFPSYHGVETQTKQVVQVVSRDKVHDINSIQKLSVGDVWIFMYTQTCDMKANQPKVTE